MSSTNRNHFEEDFLQQPSKVNEVIKLLIEIMSSNKTEGTKDVQQDIDYSDKVSDRNYYIFQRNVKFIRKSKSFSKKPNVRINVNQMTFMFQLDMSDEDRIETRRNRMIIANQFRRLGNFEYRKQNFDRAIEFYTKGISYILDSPVLYVNRSLCYIKKREFKRALMDLDYVLYKLDEKCLRAWLYKAGSLKRLNDEPGYMECIENARRTNRFKQEYINNFVDRLRIDF